MVGKDCGDDQHILMWEGYSLSPFTIVKMMGHAISGYVIILWLASLDFS
jgi:hypothetical protein